MPQYVNPSKVEEDRLDLWAPEDAAGPVKAAYTKKQVLSAVKQQDAVDLDYESNKRMAPVKQPSINVFKVQNKLRRLAELEGQSVSPAVRRAGKIVALARNEGYNDDEQDVGDPEDVKTYDDTDAAAGRRAVHGASPSKRHKNRKQLRGKVIAARGAAIARVLGLADAVQMQAAAAGQAGGVSQDVGNVVGGGPEDLDFDAILEAIRLGHAADVPAGEEDGDGSSIADLEFEDMAGGAAAGEPEAEETNADSGSEHEGDEGDEDNDGEEDDEEDDQHVVHGHPPDEYEDAPLEGGGSNKARELHQLPILQDQSMLRVMAATLDWYRPSRRLSQARCFGEDDKNQDELSMIVLAKRLLMLTKRRAAKLTMSQYQLEAPFDKIQWSAMAALSRQGDRMSVTTLSDGAVKQGMLNDEGLQQNQSVTGFREAAFTAGKNYYKLLASISAVHAGHPNLWDITEGEMELMQQILTRWSEVESYEEKGLLIGGVIELLTNVYLWSILWKGQALGTYANPLAGINNVVEGAQAAACVFNTRRCNLTATQSVAYSCIQEQETKAGRNKTIDVVKQEVAPEDTVFQAYHTTVDPVAMGKTPEEGRQYMARERVTASLMTSAGIDRESCTDGLIRVFDQIQRNRDAAVSDGEHFGYHRDYTQVSFEVTSLLLADANLRFDQTYHMLATHRLLYLITMLVQAAQGPAVWTHKQLLQISGLMCCTTAYMMRPMRALWMRVDPVSLSVPQPLNAFLSLWKLKSTKFLDGVEQVPKRGASVVEERVNVLSELPTVVLHQYSLLCFAVLRRDDAQWAEFTSPEVTVGTANTIAHLLFAKPWSKLPARARRFGNMYMQTKRGGHVYSEPPWRVPVPFRTTADMWSMCRQLDMGSQTPATLSLLMSHHVVRAGDAYPYYLWNAKTATAIQVDYKASLQRAYEDHGNGTVWADMDAQVAHAGNTELLKALFEKSSTSPMVIAPFPRNSRTKSAVMTTESQLAFSGAFLITDTLCPLDAFKLLSYWSGWETSMPIRISPSVIDAAHLVDSCLFMLHFHLNISKDAAYHHNFDDQEFGLGREIALDVVLNTILVAVQNSITSSLSNTCYFLFVFLVRLITRCPNGEWQYLKRLAAGEQDPVQSKRLPLNAQSRKILTDSREYVGQLADILRKCLATMVYRVVNHSPYAPYLDDADLWGSDALDPVAAALPSWLMRIAAGMHGSGTVARVASMLLNYDDSTSQAEFTGLYDDESMEFVVTPYFMHYLGFDVADLASDETVWALAGAKASVAMHCKFLDSLMHRQICNVNYDPVSVAVAFADVEVADGADSYPFLTSLIHALRIIMESAKERSYYTPADPTTIHLFADTSKDTAALWWIPRHADVVNCRMVQWDPILRRLVTMIKYSSRFNYNQQWDMARKTEVDPWELLNTAGNKVSFQGPKGLLVRKGIRPGDDLPAKGAAETTERMANALGYSRDLGYVKPKKFLDRSLYRQPGLLLPQHFAVLRNLVVRDVHALGLQKTYKITIGAISGISVTALADQPGGEGPEDDDEDVFYLLPAITFPPAPRTGLQGCHQEPRKDRDWRLQVAQSSRDQAREDVANLKEQRRQLLNDNKAERARAQEERKAAREAGQRVAPLPRVAAVKFSRMQSMKERAAELKAKAAEDRAKQLTNEQKRDVAVRRERAVPAAAAAAGSRKRRVAGAVQDDINEDTVVGISGGGVRITPVMISGGAGRPKGSANRGDTVTKSEYLSLLRGIIHDIMQAALEPEQAGRSKKTRKTKK